MQSMNPPIASISSAPSVAFAPSIAFAPSVAFAPSNDASISFAPSNNLSTSFASSDGPSISFAPSDNPNPAVLVNCNVIEPACRAPGTASLYLPVEHLVTLPGCHAFTQYLCVPSEQAQTGSTPAPGPSTDPYPHSGGASYHSAELFYEGDLLTDGLQISQDQFSLPSRNSCKKIRQWQQWSDEVIPSLIQPFLRYKRLSRKLHDPVSPQIPVCKNNCVCCHLKVMCINFDSKFPFSAWPLCSPCVRHTLC